MTFKEFINNLQKFAKKNPETLNMEVVASIDDEGNGHNSVIYGPTKGIFEDGEFISSTSYNDYGRDAVETNAVCIN